MTAKITDTNVELEDFEFADGEQLPIFRDDSTITRAMSWPDEWGEEAFTKADFVRDLRKVSRKIKK